MSIYRDIDVFIYIDLCVMQRKTKKKSMLEQGTKARRQRYRPQSQRLFYGNHCYRTEIYHIKQRFSFFLKKKGRILDLNTIARVIILLDSNAKQNRKKKLRRRQRQSITKRAAYYGASSALKHIYTLVSIYIYIYVKQNGEKKRGSSPLKGKPFRI